VLVLVTQKRVVHFQTANGGSGQSQPCSDDGLTNRMSNLINPDSGVQIAFD